MVLFVVRSTEIQHNSVGRIEKTTYLEALGGVLRTLCPRRERVDLQVLLDQVEDVPVRVPSTEKEGWQAGKGKKQPGLSFSLSTRHVGRQSLCFSTGRVLSCPSEIADNGGIDQHIPHNATGMDMKAEQTHADEARAPRLRRYKEARKQR